MELWAVYIILTWVCLLLVVTTVGRTWYSYCPRRALTAVAMHKKQIWNWIDLIWWLAQHQMETSSKNQREPWTEVSTSNSVLLLPDIVFLIHLIGVIYITLQHFFAVSYTQFFFHRWISIQRLSIFFYLKPKKLRSCSGASAYPRRRPDGPLPRCGAVG